MLLRRKCCLIIGLGVLACAGPAFSQATSRDEQPSWPPTPEQREQFHARMMERYMERLGKAYRLDEAQTAQVRQRLEQLRAEHEVYAAPIRQEFEAAVREWGQMRRQRSAGQQVDGQRYEQLRTRMREMWQGSPFMNPTRVVGSVEQMLPAEQVERGRKHRAEMLGEWQRRREGGERSRGDDEGRSRRGDTGRSRSGDRVSREQRSEAASPIEAPTADRWKQYVEDFARKYQLDASQRSTADSLLRTAVEQRDAYQKSHESDFAAAQAVQDPTERVQRLKSLNEPMREYFEQLKSGLEKIPTSAQRQAVEPQVAQSQPSTAPSGSRSRLRHSSRR